MQEELTGLDKIKNDAQVMKLRNKLNKRLTKYVIFKIQEEWIPLKKEIRKARKANEKAGKSEMSNDFLEDLKVFKTIGSSPTGALIQKMAYNDMRYLQLLFEQPTYEIRSKVRYFIQKSVLTSTLFDTAFKEEFGDKTISPKEFKDAEESYIARVSGKIFDEEKFSPEKGKKKTPYLEKCRKDFKKMVTRGLILATVPIPAIIIILAGIGTFAASAGAVLGGAWIWKKLSVANAHMLDKKPRTDVWHNDNFFGRKPKWFGDYKRVAFPVLQSALAITGALAFTAFSTKDKDMQVPDAVPAMKMPVNATVTKVLDGIYPIPEINADQEALQNSNLRAIFKGEYIYSPNTTQSVGESKQTKDNAKEQKSSSSDSQSNTKITQKQKIDPRIASHLANTRKNSHG